jgi:spectinomycin phosphotransferase
MGLRRAGLAFVVPPVAARSGEPAERVDERHSVSIFGYVDGKPGRWGHRVRPTMALELVSMLARLHGSTPVVRNLGSRGLDVPGRGDLEDALNDLDGPWDGGPLSELARRELAEHADEVVGALTDLDRFAVRDDGRGAKAVVSHGEPHPGNLIRAHKGLALVDWDTVALAPPERDLWMIGEANDDVATVYRDLSGVEVDRVMLRAYRELWALTDVTAFTVQLRGEHRRSADAERALAGLRSVLDGREPSPYGTGPSGIGSLPS